MNQFGTETVKLNPDAVLCDHGIDDGVTAAENRLRFWEVSHFFTCPVVGMCLTMTEQKQLLRKAGIAYRKMTPFEIHEELVGCSENENRLSRKADNMLERKFRKQSASLREFDENEFMEHWKTAFAGGDYGAALWVAATTSDLSADSRRSIFGDVHMAMHLSAGNAASLERKLSAEIEKTEEFKLKNRELTKSLRILKREKAKLEKSLNESSAEMAALEKELSKKEEDNPTVASAEESDLEKENFVLRGELNCMEDMLHESEDKVVLLKQESRKLSARLNEQVAINRQLKEKAKDIIRDVSHMNRCDTTCPSYDLCKKRVLIVGGITKMEWLYRQLIETSGGVFDYHDGYMAKGSKGLENRLKRADIVLCPVNCNSHAACSMVKNLGKKHKKTVHMMPSSSLSAINQFISDTGTPVVG